MQNRKAKTIFMLFHGLTIKCLNAKQCEGNLLTFSMLKKCKTGNVKAIFTLFQCLMCHDISYQKSSLVPVHARNNSDIA